MLIYLKEKLRLRWTPMIRKKLQRFDDKYLIFDGSHENFLRNGAWVLEESIALFHGKANPIRHVSVSDLNSMNVEKVPLCVYTLHKLYKGCWEGKAVLVGKVDKMEVWSRREFFLREIVVAKQMATHNNVHKLLGCCLETETPVLIYEWVTPQTLEDYILRKDETTQNRRVVGWKDRLRIAWEISHAVAYLHTAFPRPIIHRTLSPGTVFLDQNDAAKLSVFSFCVSIPEGEEFVKEDAVVGVYGYLAPEHSKSFRVAERVDVYSFGVLLLTLLTGKMPFFSTKAGEQSQDEILPNWVQNSIKENCINNVVDSALIGNGVSDIEGLELRASIQLALRCVVEEGDHRPSMVEVATVLKNMITFPESIPDSNSFKEGGIFRTFCGSKENFVRNETLVIQESMSLFNVKATPCSIFQLMISIA